MKVVRRANATGITFKPRSTMRLGVCMDPDGYIARALRAVSLAKPKESFDWSFLSQDLPLRANHLAIARNTSDYSMLCQLNTAIKKYSKFKPLVFLLVFMMMPYREQGQSSLDNQYMSLTKALNLNTDKFTPLLKRIVEQSKLPKLILLLKNDAEFMKVFNQKTSANPDLLKTGSKPLVIALQSAIQGLNKSC